MGIITKNTWTNIRRMPYQSLSAVMVLVITSALAQLFVIVTLQFHQILTYFETRPQVSAYFNDQTSEEDILRFKKELESKDYIAKVTYISKQEALNIYREQNKDDPLLLEMVPADVLPASLEVAPTSVDSLAKIQEDLKILPGIEEVVYQQDIIEALGRWTNGIRIFGLILIAFLVATSLLTVFVIIGMKMAARRHEISILQLLGATNRFIIGPFILEGAVYGLVAGLGSWLLTFVPLLYATPLLVDFLGEIPLFPVQPLVMVSILVGSLILGGFIGMLGSLIAVNRYVKIK